METPNTPTKAQVQLTIDDYVVVPATPGNTPFIAPFRPISPRLPPPSGTQFDVPPTPAKLKRSTGTVNLTMKCARRLRFDTDPLEDEDVVGMSKVEYWKQRAKEAEAQLRLTNRFVVKGQGYAKETCDGCLLQIENQEAHMGWGGCLGAWKNPQ